MGEGVADWLARQGLERYAPLFESEEIDLSILATLSEEDLKEIGLPLGPRRTISLALKKARDGAAEMRHDDVNAPLSERAVDRIAERRQLTIAFFDLVGSTTLAVRLDPEDLRDVMRLFLETVAATVRAYDGHVARYLGDGILVFFGWPHAFEDQTERAMAASLEVVSAVRALKPPVDAELDVRVGIATGQVVVGDEGDDTDNVTGDTPNRAQRLQSLAAPGEVVVDGATRDAAGARFTLRPMGLVAVKGFPEPLPAFTVAGEVAVDRRATGERPFLGREQEVGLVKECWALAEKGAGQILILEGEAGIGKSHLVKALQDEIASGPHWLTRFQCVDYHSNSALYPVVQYFKRGAAFLPDDGRIHPFYEDGGLGAPLLGRPGGRGAAGCPPPVAPRAATVRAGDRHRGQGARPPAPGADLHDAAPQR